MERLRLSPLRVTVLACSSALVLASLTGCSDLGLRCRDFELSLVRDTGGQASPVLAVAHFLRQNSELDLHLPTAGWHVTSGATLDAATAPTVVVASGASTLHVIRGSDGTWQVDAGKSCSKSLAHHAQVIETEGMTGSRSQRAIALAIPTAVALAGGLFLLSQVSGLGSLWPGTAATTLPRILNSGATTSGTYEVCIGYDNGRAMPPSGGTATPRLAVESYLTLKRETPTTGWKLLVRTAPAHSFDAVLGRRSLTVRQLKDGTWFVTSEQTCG